MGVFAKMQTHKRVVAAKKKFLRWPDRPASSDQLNRKPVAFHLGTMPRHSQDKYDLCMYIRGSHCWPPAPARYHSMRQKPIDLCRQHILQKRTIWSQIVFSK